MILLAKSSASTKQMGNGSSRCPHLELASLRMRHSNPKVSDVLCWLVVKSSMSVFPLVVVTFIANRAAMNTVVSDFSIIGLIPIISTPSIVAAFLNSSLETPLSPNNAVGVCAATRTWQHPWYPTLTSKALSSGVIPCRGVRLTRAVMCAAPWAIEDATRCSERERKCFALNAAVAFERS